MGNSLSDPSTSSNRAQPHPPQPPVPWYLWLPYNLYKWFFVVPVLLLSTVVIGTLIVVLCFIGLANFASRYFAALWARLDPLRRTPLARARRNT